MSNLFDFNKRFGKDTNPEDVKKNFVIKVHHLLFEPLDKKIGFNYGLSNMRMFDFVAIAFNRNPSEIIREYNSRGVVINDVFRPSFSYFSGNAFEATLFLIEVFYGYFSTHKEYDSETWLKKIDEVVVSALKQPISLGVSWRDGKFYPEGAEELDEKLISDVLKWLEKHPEVQTLYKNALDNYSQSLGDEIKRKDVINNAFQSVEKLTKEFLKTPKESIDKCFDELVKKLNLSKEWKNILHYYKELSKEFGRHPGTQGKLVPEQEDTEAFLYLSGLILRLILQKS